MASPVADFNEVLQATMVDMLTVAEQEAKAYSYAFLDQTVGFADQIVMISAMTDTEINEAHSPCRDSTATEAEG